MSNEDNNNKGKDLLYSSLLMGAAILGGVKRIHLLTLLDERKKLVKSMKEHLEKVMEDYKDSPDDLISYNNHRAILEEEIELDKTMYEYNVKMLEHYKKKKEEWKKQQECEKTKNKEEEGTTDTNK